VTTPVCDEKKIKVVYRTGLQGPQGVNIYVGNIDGGAPNSNYGGLVKIDGGTPEGYTV
jgi:hypothetical protein